MTAAQFSHHDGGDMRVAGRTRMGNENYVTRARMILLGRIEEAGG